MKAIRISRHILLLILLLFIPLTSVPISYQKAHASAPTDVNLALHQTVTVSQSTSCSSISGETDYFSVVNGVISYTNDSPCDRWTTWAKPGPDWIQLDFSSSVNFNQAKLYIYNDNGGVQPPASYTIQYWDDAGSEWVEVQQPTYSPSTPAAELNVADFDVVSSKKLRIDFVRGNAYVGLTELEIYLHYTPEDEAAAAEVQALIDPLPDVSSVALTDREAIESARIAYDNLSANQRSLITGLERLTAAESVLTSLTALPTVDISILAAFSNASGDIIELKLGTVTEATYGLLEDHFVIIADAIDYAITTAEVDPTDPSGRTIRLTLPSSVLQDRASVSLTLHSGAFITDNGMLNNAVTAFPVMIYDQLDRGQDKLIDIADIILIMGNPEWQIDLNQDGNFDRTDLELMMGQLSRMVE